MRWLDTVRALAASGISQLIECGPGKVLTGLNKRIDRGGSVQYLSIDDAAPARCRAHCHGEIARMLENDVALVTGASRGIGRAIALALADAGASVVGTSTSAEGAKAFGELLTSKG